MRCFKRLVHECGFYGHGNFTGYDVHDYGYAIHIFTDEEYENPADAEYEDYQDGYEWWNLTDIIEISEEEYDMINHCYDEDVLINAWVEQLKKEGKYKTLEELINEHNETASKEDTYFLIKK